MQSSLPYTKILVYVSVMFFLISSCKKGNDLENQITIKINSIDSETKLPRVNTFDTIEVRMVKFGFLKKRFVEVAEHITDSTGSVKIKLDCTEEYNISLYGTGVFGWADFTETDLKDGQEVIIEASPPEKR